MGEFPSDLAKGDLKRWNLKVVASAPSAEHVEGSWVNSMMMCGKYP